MKKKLIPINDSLPNVLVSGLILFAALSCCAALSQYMDYGRSTSTLIFIASCALATGIAGSIFYFAASYMYDDSIEYTQDSSIFTDIHRKMQDLKYPFIINSTAATITGIGLLAITNVIGSTTIVPHDFILINVVNSLVVACSIGVLSYFLIHRISQ